MQDRIVFGGFDARQKTAGIEADLFGGGGLVRRDIGERQGAHDARWRLAWPGWVVSWLAGSPIVIISMGSGRPLPRSSAPGADSCRPVAAEDWCRPATIARKSEMLRRTPVGIGHHESDGVVGSAGIAHGGADHPQLREAVPVRVSQRARIGAGSLSRIRVGRGGRVAACREISATAIPNGRLLRSLGECEKMSR